jgi:hypothetical protein
MARFQPAYGADFTLSKDAVKGITALVGAGVGLAEKGIEAGAAKKQTAAQRKHDKEMAALEVKKQEALARVAASSRPAISVNSGPPGWVWALVGVGTLGLAGVGYLALRRRPA